jgi:predicted TIM-barrel fold metal-dependent hydrolase
VRAKLPRSLVGGLSPGEDEKVIADIPRQALRPGLPRGRRGADPLAQELRGDRLVPEAGPSQALDLLGFDSQLVFNTFVNQVLLVAERGDDVDYAYGFARAHNRAMLDFCAADRRLLASCYVPLRDFAQSAAIAAEVDRGGSQGAARAVGLPARPRAEPPGLYPVWQQAVDAGVPIVFHVGGGIRAADNRLLDRDYFANGGPPVPDFHGGDENFRSVDYMAIPTAPMQTIATLIFDGVLDRFPTLKLGVIEQGASWVPSWMRFMDSAFEAFRKNEERLQKLALRPSEYVRRSVRATPYPAEDVGWITANAGDEVCLFSSDYPHVEGGRNPIKRFEGEHDGALRAAEAALLRRQLRRSDGLRTRRLKLRAEREPHLREEAARNRAVGEAERIRDAAIGMAERAEQHVPDRRRSGVVGVLEPALLRVVQVVELHGRREPVRPRREALIDVRVHEVAVEDDPHADEREHLGRRAEHEQRDRLEQRVEPLLAEVEPPRLEDVHLRRVVMQRVEPPQARERVQAAVHPVVGERPDEEPRDHLRGERPVRRPERRQTEPVAQRGQRGERGHRDRAAERPREHREQEP